MRRTRNLAALSTAIALCALASALLPTQASAQSDLRGILPYIMIVVDTSGSMERLPTCACTTPGCAECLPQCNNAAAPLVDKKNRWAITLEALTGDFNSFSCEPLTRSTANGMTYDLGYYLPYHQPWDCSSQSAGTPCAYNSTNATRSQMNNGILDLNLQGVRFGLMTFDGWDTYIGAPPLVATSDFDDALSEGVQGLWSYGDRSPPLYNPDLRGDTGTFHYPNCTTDYRMDTGARSDTAAEGSLVSLESCTGGTSVVPGTVASCPSWCTDCSGSQISINADIQEALLTTRPYGGTPIASSLDDLYYHFNEDLSDDFQGCRDRFALLITDGYPDDDYRSYGCNCYFEGTAPDRCGQGAINDPTAMHCPYPTAEEAAADLVEGRGSDGPQVERVYVLGLAVDDQTVVNRLNAIADAGCTGTAAQCSNGDQSGDLVPDQALFATSLPTLRAAIQGIVDSGNKAVSRTLPVFALSSEPGIPQYQFTSALKLPTQSDMPWTGVLERRRFSCSSTTPGFLSVDRTAHDDFEVELNAQTTRTLRTAFPGGVTSGELEGTINKLTGSCGSGGCNLIDLNSTTVSSALLDVASSSIRDQVFAWMYGSSGSPRESAKLGAIYHSTPVVVDAPKFDTADENFNAFRRGSLISGRPQVLYVGTNDGILHAFATGTYTAAIGSPAAWHSLVAGDELWGFVPPMLLNDLETNLTTHQSLMDGTVTVKNVTLDRSRGPSGYRTILIQGMREGGNGYVAMDVTDPFQPQFLWQLADPRMGKTYARPLIVQAKFQRPGLSGGATITREGAVAVLAGGMGRTMTNAPGCNAATNNLMRNGSSNFTTDSVQNGGGLGTLPFRSDVRCWDPNLGRVLFFVDVEDGYIVKTIHLANPGQTMSATNEPVFTSPLVGSPSAFPDDTGVNATRIFLTDADGVIWRVDMRTASNSGDVRPDDPMSGWTARPFHDMYWWGNGAGGQPGDAEYTFEAPVLSVDAQGRPVVIVGTGDTTDFARTNARNHIVSLTEIEMPLVAADSPLHFRASMNWDLREKTSTVTTQMDDGTNITVDGLAVSELVTGPMALFEGQLYAGTFISVTNSTDVCDLGRGRIFALDYTERDFTDANPTSPATYGPRRVNAGSTASNNIINVTRTATAGDNVMMLGLSLTQRPSCAESDSVYTDPYGNTWSGTSDVEDPEVYLVAHADDPRDSTNSLVRQNAGSQVTGIEIQLKPPTRYAKVISWAGSID